MKRYEFRPCRDCGMLFAKRTGRGGNNHKLCGNCREESIKVSYERRLANVRRTKSDERIIDMLKTFGQIFYKQKKERQAI